MKKSYPVFSLTVTILMASILCLMTLFFLKLSDNQIIFYEILAPLAVIVAIVRLTSILRSAARSDLLIIAYGIFILWVIILFALLYKFYGLFDTGSNQVVHDGILSLYFSIVTFTTLGYGDFLPATNLVRIVASFEAISGYMIFGLFIAAIVQIFGKK